MDTNDLYRYRNFADALIRLNNAASTLLQEGADPEAIKLILTGTAKLFSELEQRMESAMPDGASRPVDLNFEDKPPSSIPVDPDNPRDEPPGDDDGLASSGRAGDPAPVPPKPKPPNLEAGA